MRGGKPAPHRIRFIHSLCKYSIRVKDIQVNIFDTCRKNSYLYLKKSCFCRTVSCKLNRLRTAHDTKVLQLQGDSIELTGSDGGRRIRPTKEKALLLEDISSGTPKYAAATPSRPLLVFVVLFLAVHGLADNQLDPTLFPLLAMSFLLPAFP